MNLKIVTIEDCLELFEKKGISTICNDGQIITFGNQEPDAAEVDLVKRRAG